MNTLYTASLVIFTIVFLVTLIEYLTGAEREGLKFCIFIIVAFLVLSFIASSVQ